MTDKHFKRYFSAPLPDGVVPYGRSAGDSRTRKDGFLWRVQTIVDAIETSHERGEWTTTDSETQ